MKRLCAVLLALLALAAIAAPSFAQQAQVVQSCGIPPGTYAPGTTRLPTMDVNGVLCQQSANGNTSNAIFPAVNGGQIQTWREPLQGGVDSFGVSTLNTINRWATPATANGGAAATNGTCPGASCGQTTLGTGTTANGVSVLQTQKIFFERNPGYWRFQTNINLPLPNTINQYLSWGFSNVTSGTTGLSAANPCGTANSGAAAASFGFSTAGKLQAYTCASGNFQLIADLSVTQGSVPVQTSTGIWTGGCNCTPQQVDTASYKYLIDFRGDNIIWYTEQSDGSLRRVAFTTRGAAGPDVNGLNITYVALGGATPPSVSSTIQVNQVTVGDTAGNPASAVHTVSTAAAGVVLKASAGNLMSLVVTNTTASAVSAFVGNSTAVLTGSPTFGTAAGNAQECVEVPATSTVTLLGQPQPYEQFSSGISVTPSTGTCAAAIAAPSAGAIVINGAVE